VLGPERAKVFCDAYSIRKQVRSLSTCTPQRCLRHIRVHH